VQLEFCQFQLYFEFESNCHTQVSSLPYGQRPGHWYSILLWRLLHDLTLLLTMCRNILSEAAFRKCKRTGQTLPVHFIRDPSTFLFSVSIAADLMLSSVTGHYPLRPLQVKRLVSSLSSSNSKEREWAANALFWLTRENGASRQPGCHVPCGVTITMPSSKVVNQRLISEQDCLPTLVRCLRARDENGQVWSACAIASLCAENGTEARTH